MQLGIKFKKTFSEAPREPSGAPPPQDRVHEPCVPQNRDSKKSYTYVSLWSTGARPGDLVIGMATDRQHVESMASLSESDRMGLSECRLRLSQPHDKQIQRKFQSRQSFDAEPLWDDF